MILISDAISTLLEALGEAMVDLSSGLFAGKDERRYRKRLRKLKKEQEWFDQFYASSEQYRFIIKTEEAIKKLLLNNEYVRDLELNESVRTSFRKLVAELHEKSQSLNAKDVNDEDFSPRT
ncbi:hypothetical protein [Paenibacillus sp. OV219]|uniref:hypothetical protein n=1 Tax=Paenibacillus sp. OV219 TaxID=1884377 RepID=UPI0008B2E948|nr:hypothetical protein [Paenibacillus sp. OV219]SEO93463.1 hypothetical protein SAMN05518847_11319 [Paenibacillus sp. OV219]